MIQLRPYQQNAINQCRSRIIDGKKRFVLCAPTGAGKTVIFSYIVKSAFEKGKKVLVLTHRTELLTQAGGSMKELGLVPTKIEAGKEVKYWNANLYTAMIETLSRRMSKPEYIEFAQGLDLVIIDECHFGNFDKFFEHVPDTAIVIGFTATPHREKNQKSLDSMYQDLIEVISIPELIKQGFLSEPKSYGVSLDLSNVKMKGNDYDSESMGEEYSKQKVFKGVIENYLRICPSTKTIAFAGNVSSSKELCSEMVSSGLNARHLDATMGLERKQTLEWFRNTKDAILCNVGILTTGFDEPSIETIILYRATKSIPLFLQMCGRGGRKFAGKTHFNILDFGNNILTHGFWEDERKWSLKRKKKKQGAAPVKECKSCGALLPTTVRECNYCGYVFPVPKRSPEEEKIAYLKLLPKRVAMMESKKASLEEKAEMAKHKIISPYWVLHNMKDREEAKLFVRLMGWKTGWWKYNEERFPNLQKHE